MRRRVLIMGAVTAVVGLVASTVVGGYAWNRYWVGVVPAPAPPASGAPGGTPQQPKTLWDWLALLIVPLVLAGIGTWFTSQQRAQQDRRAQEERRDTGLQETLDRLGEMHQR